MVVFCSVVLWVGTYFNNFLMADFYIVVSYCALSTYSVNASSTLAAHHQGGWKTTRLSLKKSSYIIFQYAKKKQWTILTDFKILYHWCEKCIDRRCFFLSFFSASQLFVMLFIVYVDTVDYSMPFTKNTPVLTLFIRHIRQNAHV